MSEAGAGRKTCADMFPSRLHHHRMCFRTASISIRAIVIALWARASRTKHEMVLYVSRDPCTWNCLECGAGGVHLLGPVCPYASEHQSAVSRWPMGQARYGYGQS